MIRGAVYFQLLYIIYLGFREQYILLWLSKSLYSINFAYAKNDLEINVYNKFT